MPSAILRDSVRRSRRSFPPLTVACAALVAAFACGGGGARGGAPGAPPPPDTAATPPTAVVEPGDTAALAQLADTAGARSTTEAPIDTAVASAGPVEPHFNSRVDSLRWVAVRRAAARARDFRVEVSVFDRKVWAIRDRDTLLSAPAGVGMDTIFSYGGRTWKFKPPRGEHAVLRKQENPVWIPPDWYYAEVAQELNVRLAAMPPSGEVTLRDGRRLTVTGGAVAVREGSGGPLVPLPTDEDLVFDSTLFIPPIGTKNRRMEGELGRYRLDLGGGYFLHGTADTTSVGAAVTHGCVRLYDEDIAWLYRHVPLGTRVFIY